MKKLVIAVVAVLLGLALGNSIPSASAHAALERSNPDAGAVLADPPVEILLWFSEDIEIDFSRAQLIDATGKRYDIVDSFHIHTDASNPGLTTLFDEMPDGTYTLIWDVLSTVDGHRTKGAFPFFVGPPGAAPAPGSVLPTPDLGVGSGPPEWLEVAVRWFNFAGMAALIGATLFPFLVLARGLGALSEPADASSGSRRAEAESIAGRALRSSVLVAVIALLAASLASLWIQVWSAGGSATSTRVLDDVMLHTQFGETWILRVGILAIVALTAVMLSRAVRPWQQSILHRSNTKWLLLVGLAVALPLTTSLGSHAAANSSNPLNLGADWIHLVAGGVWVGGLAQLAIVVALVVPKLDERSAFFGALIRRFSLVAVPTVGVLVATGVFQSIQRLGGIGEFVDTSYGTTLLVKLGLLMPLLLFGAFNLLIVGPRFVSFARSGGGKTLSSLWEGRFRMTVIAEVALVVCILIVTAVLTNTPPPGPAQGSDVDTVVSPDIQVATKIEGDLSIAVWADPGRVGVNDLNVLLRDTDGDERAVQRVIVRIKYLDQSLGVDETDAAPIHPPDHFIANTSQFSLPGNWEVEVIVRRDGLRDTRATVSLVVAA